MGLGTLFGSHRPSSYLLVICFFFFFRLVDLSEMNCVSTGEAVMSVLRASSISQKVE